MRYFKRPVAEIEYRKYRQVHCMYIYIYMRGRDRERHSQRAVHSRDCLLCLLCFCACRSCFEELVCIFPCLKSQLQTFAVYHGYFCKVLRSKKIGMDTKNASFRKQEMKTFYNFYHNPPRKKTNITETPFIRSYLRWPFLLEGWCDRCIQ